MNESVTEHATGNIHGSGHCCLSNSTHSLGLLATERRWDEYIILCNYLICKILNSLKCTWDFLVLIFIVADAKCLAGWTRDIIHPSNNNALHEDKITDERSLTLHKSIDSQWHLHHVGAKYLRSLVPDLEQHWPHLSVCTLVELWVLNPWSSCMLRLRHLKRCIILLH